MSTFAYSFLTYIEYDTFMTSFVVTLGGKTKKLQAYGNLLISVRCHVLCGMPVLRMGKILELGILV